MTVDRDDSTGAVFYLDGAPIRTFDPTILTGSVDNPDPLYLGRDTITTYANSQYFVGLIDEFAYYNVALAAEEVEGIFVAGAEGKVTDSCGDGVLDDGEDCDGAALDGESCETLGLGTGPLACSEHCTFDDVACAEDEVCDDGSDNDGDGLLDCDDDDCAADAACVASGDDGTGSGDGTGSDDSLDTGAGAAADGDGKGGCNCTVSSGAAPALVPLLLGLVGLVRRRR